MRRCAGAAWADAQGGSPTGECEGTEQQRRADWHTGVATSPTLTERLTEVLCRLVNGPAESCQVSEYSEYP